MTDANRRPLTSRDTPWAKAAAARLAASRITPNQISMASAGFAALGLLLFWAASATGGLVQSLALMLAAATIQARLLCNLLDGMVAVEGGKSAPSGPFWNEAPDRLADLLFLAGAGLAAGQPALGLLAAALYAPDWTLTVTLWIITLGTAATALRRSLRLLANLNAR